MYTQEMIEYANTMWVKGYPAARIAAEINSVYGTKKTRMSVIGMAWRNRMKDGSLFPERDEFEKRQMAYQVKYGKSKGDKGKIQPKIQKAKRYYYI